MTSGLQKLVFYVGAAFAIFLSAGTIFVANINTTEIARVAMESSDPSRRLEFAAHRNNVGLAYMSYDRSDAQEVLYGYYSDLDAVVGINKERLNLRIEPPTVVGTAKGQVAHNGTIIERTWEVKGFYRDQQLVLGILTRPSEADPKPSTGIGGYYLAKDDADDFTGTAIYFDCVHQFVQCPYALTTRNFTANEAKDHWPQLFKRACEMIDLTPGRQSPQSFC